MEDLLSFFKEEKDVFYVRGKRKRKQKTGRDLLRKTNFTAERIVAILEVSLDQVLAIQAELKP